MNADFRSRDKPLVNIEQLEAALRQVRTQRAEQASPQNISGGAGFYFGTSGAGKLVTETTAMQLTAVYACVRVLSETIAGLPLHLYRYTDDGGKIKAFDQKLYTLLHDAPNPEMTSFTFRETMMAHLLLNGNAYAQKIHNGRGEIVALYPLMTDRMSVQRDTNGRIVYLYTYCPDDSLQGEKTVVALSKEDVWHIPGLGFNGLIGFSPIAMARNALGLSIAAEEYGSKFFANGAQPSGVLEHPGHVNDPDKLRRSWQETFGGSSNSNKTAVLEEGMKYHQISIPPDQAQFLETRKFQINEIARIFRVPPHMIGDLDKASFSNIEQQSIDFGKHSVTPWVVRWEQSMWQSLLDDRMKREYFWRFNMDGLMRGDYLSRMQGYAVGRQNGWLSANDIHEFENLDRIPADQGGDLYLINGNMLPLNQAGAFAAGNQQKGGK